MATQLKELLPALAELDRIDKLRAMHFLISELAKDESLELGRDVIYPVWSPFDSFEAAQTLLGVLQTDVRSHE